MNTTYLRTSSGFILSTKYYVMHMEWHMQHLSECVNAVNLKSITHPSAVLTVSDDKCRGNTNQIELHDVTPSME